MSEGMGNSPLRHVTLLEEAHNLLRKDNVASTAGSNLRTASVEMITNAIADTQTLIQRYSLCYLVIKIKKYLATL